MQSHSFRAPIAIARKVSPSQKQKPKSFYRLNGFQIIMTLIFPLSRFNSGLLISHDSSCRVNKLNFLSGCLYNLGTSHSLPNTLLSWFLQISRSPLQPRGAATERIEKLILWKRLSESELNIFIICHLRFSLPATWSPVSFHPTETSRGNSISLIVEMRSVFRAQSRCDSIGN